MNHKEKNTPPSSRAQEGPLNRSEKPQLPASTVKRAGVPKRRIKIGDVFSRLTVICKSDRMYSGVKLWKCRCICGSITDAFGGDLNSGHIRSCGCLRKETATRDSTTHGLYRTRENSIWRGMLSRCYNVNSPPYPDYGGRGITVCDRWRHSFANFLEDMGQSFGLTLDRKNNDEGYSKANCRWATRKEQANNRRNRRWWKKPAMQEEAKFTPTDTQP